VSKKERKKRGKKTGTCLDCGKTLRENDRKCKRCRRPSRLFTPKSARRPYLVKGGNVVPLARPVCWNGHTGKHGQRCCTACGEPFGISKMAHEQIALKAAGAVPTGYWAGQMHREADPGQQELMRSLAFKAAGGMPGPEMVARAWGYTNLYDAALNCRVPDAARYFQHAYYNGGRSA
jgi:hypothetical protein